MGILSLLTSFIPSNFFIWITYILFAVGLALYLISKVVDWLPHLHKLPDLYRFPIEVLGVVMLVAGAYLFGSYGTEMQRREMVAELQAKVAQAEEQAKTATVVIDHKAEVKIKVIKERGQIVRQYVDREITKYNNTCVIPNEFVNAHNAAAKNEDLK